MRRADSKDVGSTSPTALQKLEFKVVLGGHGRCMAASNNSTGFELNMERNCTLFHSVRDLTLNLKKSAKTPVLRRGHAIAYFEFKFKLSMVSEA